jgi:hypothetical protein
MRQHALQKPWKLRFEVVPAQRHEAVDARGAGLREARVPQHLQVVAEGRLRDRNDELPARQLIAVAQRLDNAEPDGVAQRVQDTRERHLVSGWVRDDPHEAKVRCISNDDTPGLGVLDQVRRICEATQRFRATPPVSGGFEKRQTVKK